MIFFKPSTDFFGPAADQLRCQIMLDTPVVHLIPNCGERVVEAINNLAIAIKASKSQPEWQRRNGSIVYHKLPADLQRMFKETDFDEKGYINLRKLHMITPYALYGESKALRSEQKRNHCRLPGCMDESKPIRSVTTCAALTYRLAEGKAFDVRKHTYSEEIPKVDLSNNAYINLMDIQNSLDGLFKVVFGRIWEKGEALKEAREVREQEQEANALGSECLSFFRSLFSQNFQATKSSMQGNTLACCLVLLCLFFSQSLLAFNDQSGWMLSIFSKNTYIDMTRDLIGKVPFQYGNFPVHRMLFPV